MGTSTRGAGAISRLQLACRAIDAGPIVSLGPINDSHGCAPSLPRVTHPNAIRKQETLHESMAILGGALRCAKILTLLAGWDTGSGGLKSAALGLQPQMPRLRQFWATCRSLGALHSRAFTDAKGACISCISYMVCGLCKQTPASSAPQPIGRSPRARLGNTTRGHSSSLICSSDRDENRAGMTQNCHQEIASVLRTLAWTLSSSSDMANLIDTHRILRVSPTNPKSLNLHSLYHSLRGFAPSPCQSFSTAGQITWPRPQDRSAGNPVPST
ncbi:hypothetical protein GP486_005297 [Trichoglossum hirsutum]|uniref:Uncharacterized protein n=1 Tax=Trichoglossum hirsutum TaxID=265104 RepID=A0A9P8RMJ2_9PEZI|nr:hypothetical protein GP486_005297 [Trichoglossum hirsutum]